MLAQVPERLTDTDPRRDAQELRARHRPRDADEDRQPCATSPDIVHPAHGHARIETDLARDVGGVARLLEHGGDRRLVVDQRMALRVAGDPDLLERVADCVHRIEQGRGAVVGARRLVGIAGDDEDVVHTHLRHPRYQLGEMRAVDHEARREVRHDRIPVSCELAGELECVVEPLRRRRGDGERDVSWNMLEHLLLGARERDHLVARAREQLGEGRLPANRCRRGRHHAYESGNDAFLRSMNSSNSSSTASSIGGAS